MRKTKISKVRKWCTEDNISISELKRLLQIDRYSAWQIFAGNRKPDQETAEKISQFSLGKITVEELLLPEFFED
ncbi:MAG: hypothetical protein ABFQ95_00965 [Pseudomonadota bacterium]